MLVLARKKLEMIQIGGDVVITVLRIDSGTVRIGIDAPASTRVLRGELVPTGADGLCRSGPLSSQLRMPVARIHEAPTTLVAPETK